MKDGGRSQIEIDVSTFRGRGILLREAGVNELAAMGWIEIFHWPSRCPCGRVWGVILCCLAIAPSLHVSRT
jgi:hypothetical protein